MMEKKARAIIDACKNAKSTNPIKIFNTIAKEDFVAIHGPEHHVLDGASILTAYKNAGGEIDLENGLAWMMEQGLKMPGAACGHWGVCGSVTSIGAAIAFIDGTGPLSTDGSWGKHMEFTSKAVKRMGEINGPRCCKRDGYISLEAAIDFINENYDVTLGKSAISCDFSPENKQCIGERCPYHK